MRVLIDGTSAQGGGGFTYLVNVVPRLVERAPEAHFHLLLRNPRVAEALSGVPRVEFLTLGEAGLFERLRFAYLELPRRARKTGADLVYSVGEFAPLGAPCPTIASFRNPNVFDPEDRGWPPYQRLRLRLLRAVARASARACRRVVFVSADSAQWMGDRIGLAPEKRTVVYHGIDRERWSAPARGGIHPRPFVLSVSTVYRYKNFVRLIEAWRYLAELVPETPDLVIVGDDQDPPYSAQMEAARNALGLGAERIHLRGPVPYAEIQAYYAAAQAFAFPSLLETFGHPLLESMAAGIPVVAADIPVFREVAGNAAEYADARDPESLATAIAAVLEPRRREELVSLGREHIGAFTWERTADQLATLFRDVVA